MAIKRGHTNEWQGSRGKKAGGRRQYGFGRGRALKTYNMLYIYINVFVSNIEWDLLGRFVAIAAEVVVVVVVVPSAWCLGPRD